MRRFLLLAFLTLVSLLAAPGLPSAQAGDPGHSAELRKLRVIAGGAAAEATYRAVCQPDDSPVFLSLGLHQDGVDFIASGTISSFTCTGSAQRLVVPLQNATGMGLQPVRTGAATVHQNLWNCVEGRDPCYDEPTEVSATVVKDSFIAPYDEDLAAELTLVRTKLLLDGTVRVVYDLTCTGPRSTPVPVESTITQVTPRGTLRYGSGGEPGGGMDVECDTAVQRYRYTVAPTAGRFREGTSFLDTSFGSRFDSGVYATDQHPQKLKN